MLQPMLQGFFALFLSVTLGLNHANAANNEELEELRPSMSREWILTKDDRLRHIKTYFRLEDGKQYRSFKVEAVFESSIKTLANVLLDFDNYTKWYWKTRESRLLKQPSNTEYIVYFVHEAPQGLADRDVILQCIIEPQTKTKRAITLKVTALPNFLPIAPPLIRMPAEDISIKFSPLPNGKIQLVAEGYFDPGGSSVPVWATNFVQRTAPYVVIRNFQRMLERDEYRNSKKPLPFPVFDDSDY
jgi:hypothetical protein